MTLKKVGFIGYGHMGSVLLKSLLSAHALHAEQVIISTRTQDKLAGLHAEYPAIELAETNRDVARQSGRLFLCVGTSQVKDVLVDINDVMSLETHLIIISGGLEIASVETLFGGAVTKVMPTIIAEVQKGVTLVCHNDSVRQPEREWIGHILEKIGMVKCIQEPQFEIGADLTSCMPGLFACMCDQFIQAVILQGDLTYHEASEMLLATLDGTLTLFQQTGERFPELIRRVATKGGATEGGVGVLQARLPDVFKEVLAVTSQRHDARKQMTRHQFMNV